MSSHWFQIGRHKLRPEPRIARLNLQLVFALAFSSLLLGSTTGRSVPSRAHRGLHESRSACGPKHPLEDVTVELGKSDDLAPETAVHRSTPARVRRPACSGSRPA